MSCWVSEEKAKTKKRPNFSSEVGCQTRKMSTLDEVLKSIPRRERQRKERRKRKKGRKSRIVREIEEKTVVLGS